MKKFLKLLAIIFLMITIMISLLIIISELVKIIRIIFFGMTVGSNTTLDSIWFYERNLKGIDGLKTYYTVVKEIVYMFEIPILIINLIYQIVYFKVIQKYH